MKLFRSYRIFYPNYFQIFTEIGNIFPKDICVQTAHMLLPISSFGLWKKRDYRIVNFRWRIPDHRFLLRFVYCPSGPWYPFDTLNLSVKSTFEGSSQIKKWVMPSLIDRNHIGVNHTLSLGIYNLGNVPWFCLELDHFLNFI